MSLAGWYNVSNIYFAKRAYDRIEKATVEDHTSVYFNRNGLGR